MKITKKQIKQLIKEELASLEEQLGGERRVAGRKGSPPLQQLPTRQHQGALDANLEAKQINRLSRQLYSATDTLSHMSGTDEKVVYTVRRLAETMIDRLNELVRGLEESELQSRPRGQGPGGPQTFAPHQTDTTGFIGDVGYRQHVPASGGAIDPEFGINK